MNAESAYLFRHALLRDAAYQLQLPGHRARLHAFALEAIEALCGGRAPPPPRLDRRAGCLAHETDAFAEALALHARHSTGSPPDLRRLYVYRSAEAAERGHRHGSACDHWEELAGLLDGTERAEALRRAGDAARRMVSTARAEALFRRSLDSCGSDARVAGEAWTGLAGLFVEMGRPADAEDAARRAIELLRASGPGAEGDALRILASILRDGPRGAEAEGMLREALRLHRRERLLRPRAQAFENLGIFYFERGRLQRAERVYRAALSILRRVADLRAEGHLLQNVAILYRNTGRVELAEATALRALELDRLCGSRRFEGNVLGTIAVIRAGSGRHEEAELAFGQALAIHREVGNRRSEGTVLHNLASLLNITGRVAQAEAMLATAIEIHREARDRRFEGVSLSTLSGLLHQTNRLEEAETAAQRALVIHREMGNRPAEGVQLCRLAALQLEKRREAEARRSWGEGTAILARLGLTNELEEQRRDMRAACGKAGVAPFENE